MALEQAGSKVKADIAELKQKQRDLQDQEDILRRLEDSLRGYHGLPPDLEASRVEVQRAQAELNSWKKRREELFEKMGRG
jgi:uncharacterized coiled-coil DUF342 family protein